jgi:hypothetical protein
MPCLPIVNEIREVEEPAHYARFGVLGGTSEETVVVKVEVNDFAFAVDGEAFDVMTKIAISADALWVDAHVHASHVAIVFNVRILIDGLLTLSLRMDPERAVVVTIPEADDQRHESSE